MKLIINWLYATFTLQELRNLYTFGLVLAFLFSFSTTIFALGSAYSLVSGFDIQPIADSIKKMCGLPEHWGAYR